MLNHALANEAVLALKTLSADRNIMGASFFALHDLFDSQFKQLIDISHQIAEGARMLGGNTIGSLQEFIDFTRLEEQHGIVPDALQLLKDHEKIIHFLREDAKKCSEEFEEEDIFELIMSVIRLHEKMVLILRSLLESPLTENEPKKSGFENSTLGTFLTREKYELIL